MSSCDLCQKCRNSIIRLIIINEILSVVMIFFFFWHFMLEKYKYQGMKYLVLNFIGFAISDTYCIIKF